MEDMLAIVSEMVMFQGFNPPPRARAYYPERMGWYLRPSTMTYEFWWMGTEPIVSVTVEVLMSLPTFAEKEIRCAVEAKGEAGVLR